MVFPAILCFQNSPFEVTYPLLYSKWITNKEDLLYSTWSGALLNFMWQPGWEEGLGENGYMCLYG